MTSADLERLLHTVRLVYGLSDARGAVVATVRFTFDEDHGSVVAAAGLLATRQDTEHFVSFARGEGDNVELAFAHLWVAVTKFAGAARDRAEDVARKAGLPPWKVT